MGDLTPDRRIAYIKASDTKSTIKTQAPKASIVNFGPDTVYFRDEVTTGALNRDDDERIGEIPIRQGDSLPLPDGISKFDLQCKTGEAAELWFVPLRS